MKLSYEWLKELVPVTLSCEEVAEKLTMSGSEVEKIEAVGSEKVMDLEITTNRPDCLSMLGLAREVSALTGVRLAFKDKEISSEDKFAYPCEVKEPSLCPRYTARAIKSVNVKSAPEKIVTRLKSLGMRSVNNVVDVTNYCLMETGQPMHAFDMDRIEGGKLIVRLARKKEKIVTIDGVERELDESVLVIADAKRPVAIAGIMGGKDTEVTERTKNVVLESAYFDPNRIRQTARKLALSSDSSYRFERGVDKGAVLRYADIAASLIAEDTGGKICEVTDIAQPLRARPEIEFSAEDLIRYAGTEIPEGEALKILKLLGMDVNEKTPSRAKVTAPTFREDITRQADLIEEVMRIYGYDKIPAEVKKFIPAPSRKDRPRRVKDRIRALLPRLGMTEIVTYSLVSDGEARLMGGTGELVRLANPISEERSTLTPDLTAGMLGVIRHNVNRKNPDLALFEIGKSYSKGSKAYLEKERLSLALTGKYIDNWVDGRKEAGFYHLKGVIEELLQRIAVPCSFITCEHEAFDQIAKLEVNKKGEAGFIGKLSARLLEEYGLEQEVVYAELALDKIGPVAELKRRYTPVDRFPSSKRDISVLADEELPGGKVKDVITASGGPLLKASTFVDIYRGEQIPPGKKSLTFSLEYGLSERTLTEEEVEKAHAGVKEAIKRSLSVSFR